MNDLSKNRHFSTALQWLGYFSLYLLIYALLFPRFGLHQDDVLNYSGQADATYLAAGRWGVAAYRSIFGTGANPWSYGIASGLYLATALILQCRLFRLHGALQKILYGTLYFSCIQFAYILRHSDLADCVSLGFLFCSLAAALIFDGKGKTWEAAATVVLLGLAISFYQMEVLYFSSLCIACYFFRGTWNRKEILLMGFSTTAAVILWFLVKQITLPFVDEGLKAYTLRYQAGLTQWSTILHAEPKRIILFLVHYTKLAHQDALGMSYAGQLYGSCIIPLLYLAIKTLLGRNKTTQKILNLSLLYILWISPFILSIMLGSNQPPHTYLCEPLCGATLWMLCLRRPEKLYDAKRYLLLSLAALISLKALYTVSKMASNERFCFERNISSLRCIRSYGMAMADRLQLAPDCPIICISTNTQRKMVHKSIGLQPLPDYPDPVKSGTLMWYLDQFELHPLRSPNKEDEAELEELLKDSPAVWPDRRSIRVLNGKIFVNIDFEQAQKEWAAREGKRF